MPQDRALWEIRVGVYATREQADEIQDRIARLLCPDPDHRSPCPVPWATALADADTLAAEGTDYSELVEQYLLERLAYRIERGELPPGRALPSRSELMTAYGLSDAGVRRVIETLREAGLVESAPGRGAVVARRPGA